VYVIAQTPEHVKEIMVFTPFSTPKKYKVENFSGRTFLPGEHTLTSPTPCVRLDPARAPLSPPPSTPLPRRPILHQPLIIPAPLQASTHTLAHPPATARTPTSTQNPNAYLHRRHHLFAPLLGCLYAAAQTVLPSCVALLRHFR
jgi:hypothetical protein